MDTNLKDQIFSANFAQICGDFEAAVQQYTIILAQKEIYEILIEKIIALTSLHSLEFAVKECENAIIMNKKRYEGYFRRGICQFLQGKFKAALIDFEESLEKLTGNSALIKKQIEMWVQKCKAEIDNKNLKDQLKNQITQKVDQQQPQTEAKKAPEQPEQPSAKIEVEEKKSGPAEQSQAPDVVKTSQLSSTGKIIYTWYQTQYKVGIDINYTLDKREKLKSSIQPKKIEVSFPVSEGNDFELSLDLFDEIIPEKSKVLVHLSKIEVLLQKKESNKSWPRLEQSDTKAQAQETQNQEQVAPKVVESKPQQSVYPSSSKQKRDWDKIDKELEQEITKNKEEYEQGDQFQNFMKVLYANADENTRRAMIKSYQTSGGTVLSTNWDEVQKKDYAGKDRPEPPKGQVEKKWDK